MSEFETDNRGYDDEPRGYERDGSRSPRGDNRSGGDSRARSASPGGRDRIDNRGSGGGKDDESTNPGTNLFVTGIHPRLSEADVAQLFEKFGEVEKANIMRDPHSGDSRGFGFVKMVTSEGADAARDNLQGVNHEGRTLSIEKARRARPRTPTPGKYYGPPKREFGGRPPRGGGRFDDRRGGGGGGRRDDYYGGSGGGGGYRGSRYGGDRYEERGDSGYDRRYRDRGDYSRTDRYASGGQREERYGGREERYSRDDRRGGGGGGGAYYGREERGNGAYEQPAPRESREAYSGSGGRGYDDRGDDRHSR